MARIKTSVAILVAASLATSAVQAEVVTLSCSATIQAFVPNQMVAPTQALETLVIDLGAGTVKGPAGTGYIKATDPLIWWIGPLYGSLAGCQTGDVDRVSGEYENFAWRESCQEVQAFLDAEQAGRFGGNSVRMDIIWRGICKPANKMF